ncbi:hypothetical protein [Brevundimonas sp. A19_0]|uniref:hypothetical protein n=1 Tax=Brevundimonas sp. A19_0 TaxID=2821087 RepID=UPI001AD9F2A4|nr:hypothetical protein [Brevundimonas sp. A19_0]MBO9502508.1 hypothetical protein [Brevundimonas sp. A19_0]
MLNIETPETDLTANGATDAFATGFSFVNATEVRVSVEIDGVVSDKTLDTHYTIGAGDWPNDGATITFTAGNTPPNGARVIIRRVTPASQGENFGDLERFQPQQAERAYDKLSRKAQETSAEADRAIKVPVGEAATVLPRAPVRAGKVFAYDDDGNPNFDKGVDELAQDAADRVTAPALANIAERETEALAAVGERETQATDAVDALATTALGNIGSAGDAELAAIGNAGDSELSQIGDAGDDELADIAAAGAAQVAAVASQPGADQYASTADALSKGVWSVTIAAAGSGGTNGTYAWTTTGGTGTGATGYLVIAGGVVTQVAVTHRGKGYTTGEALAITGTHGLTGHTLTLVTAQNEAPGKVFQVVTADAIDNYKVDPGGTTATPQEGPATKSVVAALDDRTGEIERLPQSRLTWAAADRTGSDRVSLGVTEDGEIVGGGLEKLRNDFQRDMVRRTPGPNAHPLRAVNGCLLWGQSLATGYGAKPVLSTAQPYDNIWMLNGGVTQPAGSGLTALVPMISQANGTGDYQGETPLPGMAMAMNALMGGRYPAFGFAWGLGGTRLVNLMKGSPTYTGWLAALVAGNARFEALDMSLAIQAIFGLHGAEDEAINTAKETYKTNWRQHDADQVADIMATTGQDWRPKHYISPTLAHTYYNHATPVISQAQWELYLEDKVNRIIIGPRYQYETNAFSPVPPGTTPDRIHIINHAQRAMGEKLAQIRYLVEVWGEAWMPTHVLEVEQDTDRSVVVTWHVPHGPLVLDDVRVTDPGAYGMELSDADGAKTIASVTLLGHNKTRVAATTALGASKKFAYAHTGTPGDGNGPTRGARGCLRDSDPWPSIYLDALGRPYEHFNWAVPCQVDIP